MTVKIVQQVRQALLNPAWICFTWFGMTAGVSLLATPAKFMAPTITRPVALDVGRAVFGALNKAEIIALVVLLVVVRLSGEARRWWAVAGVLTLIVLAQSAWLLPELAARTQMVVEGVELPPSMAHGLYSSLELVKLGLLLYLGISSTRTGP